MRLHLDLPESWTLDTSRANPMVTIEPGLTIEITRLADLPEAVFDWVHTAALQDRAPDLARVDETGRTDERTDLGSPMTLVASTASDAGGEVVEQRLHAVYVFVEHGAIVAVRARPGTLLSPHRDEIVRVLKTAHPVFGVSAGASLADLLAT